MLKKMFIVWGAVFCLQAAQSEIINISGGWKQMHEEILSRVRNFSGNAMVGLDCDNIMCYFDFIKETQLTDGMLITTLQDLDQAQTPFFCITAAASTEWPDRRRDFEKISVAHLFKKESRCFLKEWRQEESDEKKYYVDTEWNTVYTKRTIGSVFTEQNPASVDMIMELARKDPETYRENLEYIRLQEHRKCAANCSPESKGYVFNELIKDGFIARPDLFIFVDDKRSNLDSIEEVCAPNGIPFIGLHCESYILTKQELEELWVKRVMWHYKFDD